MLTCRLRVIAYKSSGQRDKMAPQTRKRKANSESADQEPHSTETKTANIIGGMSGDYRVTGKETSESFDSFTITSEDDKDIPCQKWLHDESAAAHTTLIFTHGAGGGLDNPATKLFAQGYASKSSIVCFQGTMNLKSRLKSFQNVFDELQAQDPEQEFAAGGRSMGARAAVMLAHSNESIKKLVLCSYPLTSPKGDKRDEILLELPKDRSVLFIIGSNDNMCDLEELQKVQKKMKAKSLIRIVDGADHGMSLSKVPKGQKKAEVIELLRQISGQEAAAWVAGKSDFKNMSTLDLDMVKIPIDEPESNEDQEPEQSPRKRDETKGEKGTKRRKKR